jgi:hypothetical protein
MSTTYVTDNVLIFEIIAEFQKYQFEKAKIQ